MILAQFSASQVPYNQIDWLQIGVYFLALPIVALLGAALGLLGRTRRGGILWSTNVGLLGGIVACLVCILAITTLDQKLPSGFVSYFEGSYRWLMLLAALGATGGCALAAGIAWRFTHKPREVQPFSFSLSQLMLVQLFAFLSLGAWIGFRLYVLSSVSPGEYRWRAFNDAVARWSAVGWDVYQGRLRHATIDLSKMDAEETAEAIAVVNAKDMVHFPDLAGFSLKLNDDSALELNSLLAQQQIKNVSLEFGAISDKSLNQIAQSQIESLSLMGNLSGRDLSLLAQSPNLKRLVIFGPCSRTSIASLGESKSLKEILIYDAYLPKQGSSAIAWPTSLESLTIGDEKPVPLDRAALASIPPLKSLSLYGSILDEDDIAFLKTLPPIERLDFLIGSPTEAIARELASLSVNDLEQGYLTLFIKDTELTQEEAALLTPIKKLRCLQLQRAEHGDDIFTELALFRSLERVETSSPKVTLEGLWKLADMPNLNWLYYPKKINSPEFNKKFREHRKSINGPVNIDGILMPIAGNASAATGAP